MKNAGRCPDPPRNFLKEVSWNFKNFCKKILFFRADNRRSNGFARTRQRFPPLAASPSLPSPVAPVPRETSPQKGSQSQRDGIVPRGSPSKQVLPRIPKLSLLCTKSLSATSPVLPVPRGSRGGGAALSSLCRRFPGGDIMNLTSRRNPLSGLSFSEFFFLRRKKNG